MAWRPLGQTPLTIPFRGRCRRASGQNVGVSTAAALRWSLWQASRSRRGALKEQSKAEGGVSRYRLHGLFAKILASAANWGTFFGPSFGVAGRSHFGGRLSLNVTKTSKGQRAVPIWGSDAVRLWTRRQTAAAATCKRFKRNEAALAGLGKSIYVGRPVRLALGVGPDIIHPPACVERTASNALVCDLRSGAFAMSVLAARSHPCALRA